MNTDKESWPPEVLEVASKYPVETPDGKLACYRSTQDARWHFAIVSYDRPRAPGAPVTVTLAHGRDSSSPGIATFGQSPDQLVACNCGKWLPPTQYQIEKTRQKIERLSRRRRN